MELLQELFVTVIVAVLFSFLIAKLVSLGAADSNNSNKPELSNTQNLDQANTSGEMDEITMEELSFHDNLTTEGLKSEKRVEFVQDFSTTVDKLSGESKSVYADEVIETELQTKLISSEDVLVIENRETETVEIEKSSACNDVVLDEIIGAVLDFDKEKDEKKIEVVEIDDDWEGIERTELEKMFAEAAKFVECGDVKDEEGLRMELYALHKVATEGPCREQPPMPLHFAARAKWNAWQRLGNMNPEVAMEQYVALVSAKVPGWMDDTSNGNDEPGSSEAENPGVLASDLSTSSSNGSSITERTSEETPHIEKKDSTEGPNLQTRAKE
ncbi:acyl-CoA-binding domain-containing protein 3-like [Mercurialis annua]|uniref:acyl-CoA-binding domain-containing protein 3-like n=1 Tax=Mercurialis annua TaxID=3986 RepID=UPI002160B85E|nr:acyl-CoA-binding domain-containing protein 3-like [Mercurialis annua]